MNFEFLRAEDDLAIFGLRAAGVARLMLESTAASLRRSGLAENPTVQLQKCRCETPQTPPRQRFPRPDGRRPAPQRNVETPSTRARDGAAHDHERPAAPAEAHT